MTQKTQPTHEMPGGQAEAPEDDGVVNDSLGTIDLADVTGIDDEKVKNDAKKNNPGKRED